MIETAFVVIIWTVGGFLAACAGVLLWVLVVAAFNAVRLTRGMDARARAWEQGHSAGIGSHNPYRRARD